MYTSRARPRARPVAVLIEVSHGAARFAWRARVCHNSGRPSSSLPRAGPCAGARRRANESNQSDRSSYNPHAYAVMKEAFRPTLTGEKKWPAAVGVEPGPRRRVDKIRPSLQRRSLSREVPRRFGADWVTARGTPVRAPAHNSIDKSVAGGRGGTRVRHTPLPGRAGQPLSKQGASAQGRRPAGPAGRAGD